MEREPNRSVFEEHRDELERFTMQMGAARGRLAVALDVLTDAVVLVGQHAVYCHAGNDPEAPTRDMKLVLRQIEHAKELLSSVMEEIRQEREARRGG